MGQLPDQELRVVRRQIKNAGVVKGRGRSLNSSALNRGLHQVPAGYVADDEIDPASVRHKFPPGVNLPGVRELLHANHAWLWPRPHAIGKQCRDPGQNNERLPPVRTETPVRRLFRKGSLDLRFRALEFLQLWFFRFDTNRRGNQGRIQTAKFHWRNEAVSFAWDSLNEARIICTVAQRSAELHQSCV